MPVFTKRFFSGSSGGRSISIATGLTTLHTSVSVTSDSDEIFFYVHNTASVSRKVTAYVGATLAKDKVVQAVPPRDGYYLVGPGMPLGLGKILKALSTAGVTATGAAVAGTLTAWGWVNRIDQ